MDADIDDLLRSRGRLMVVAAHPDDEILGAGALLTHAAEAFVVHVTDGAPRDGVDARGHGFPDVAAYAAARRREAEAALRCAGVSPDRIIRLDAADQEATFALDPLARALSRAIADRRPTLLLAHPYEGGHPDHDAAAFIARAAVTLQSQEAAPAVDQKRAGVPVLAEMASYHAAPDGAGVRRLVFIERRDHPETVRGLDDDARAHKARMLRCHATQARVLSDFPLDAERFRAAPAYDFSRPPHAGRLLYERAGSGAAWGIDGARWRSEAVRAWGQLGLGA